MRWKNLIWTYRGWKKYTHNIKLRIMFLNIKIYVKYKNICLLIKNICFRLKNYKNFTTSSFWQLLMYQKLINQNFVYIFSILSFYHNFNHNPNNLILFNRVNIQKVAYFLFVLQTGLLVIAISIYEILLFMHQKEYKFHLIFIRHLFFS